jgi:hypothetical protein
MSIVPEIAGLWEWLGKLLGMSRLRDGLWSFVVNCLT